MYRFTKEGNINELRHNSMYGYENKRNSLVYRYTRTAPKKGFGGTDKNINYEEGGNVTTISFEDGTVSPEERWLPDRFNSQSSAWWNGEGPFVADGMVISSSTDT